MKRIIPVFVLAVYAISATVRADTSLGTVKLTFVQAIGGTVIAGGEDVYAGPYQYNLTSPSNPTVAPLTTTNPINGFCIDFHDNITNGNNGTFEVQTLANFFNTDSNQSAVLARNPNVVTDIEALMSYASAVPGITVTNGGHSYTGNVNLNNPQKSAASAGLGLAIWEVLQETQNNGSGGGHPSFSVNNGTFQASANTTYSDAYTGADIDYANALLADLNVGDPFTVPTTIYALNYTGSDPTLQGQCVIYAGTLSGTPEPGVFVGLIGLVCCCMPIAGARLLRRRRATA